MITESQNSSFGKMKVVMLLSNAYNPDDRVRNEALALDHSKYDITILAWDRFLDKPQQEVIDGITIKRMRLKTGYGQGIGKFFIYSYVWILFFVQVVKLDPEIIHCHDFDTYLVGIFYAWFNKKTKVVFDAHENYYLMMKPLVSTAISRLIAHLEKKYTQHADLVIASCDANAKHYREMGAKKTVVVGNWKDPNLYVFPSEQIEKKRCEIGANHHLIVTYIGSLTMDRNVLPLIHAIQERPWAFVIIGGTGGQELEIKQLCSNLPNAYYPGYIHPEDVPLFTSISDVIYYGLDSTDVYAPYNAPNKLFEALAAGKSIIASDLGGELSNIVKAVGCGILISHLNSSAIGEALDRIKNSELRKALEYNSKLAGISYYNWKLASIKLRDAYQELLQK
jgi:glycosyltransferase involved in cell wall biosynthesis